MAETFVRAVAKHRKVSYSGARFADTVKKVLEALPKRARQSPTGGGGGRQSTVLTKRTNPA